MNKRSEVKSVIYDEHRFIRWEVLLYWTYFMPKESDNLAWVKQGIQCSTKVVTGSEKQLG